MLVLLPKSTNKRHSEPIVGLDNVKIEIVFSASIFAHIIWCYNSFVTMNREMHRTTIIQEAPKKADGSVDWDRVSAVNRVIAGVALGQVGFDDDGNVTWVSLNTRLVPIKLE